MILKIAICDDDLQVISVYKRIIESYSIQNNIDFEIDLLSSGKDLIKKYSEGVSYNALFLDIELSNENGIEIAEKIKSTYDRNVFIVFISNYPKYMMESFSVHPYCFLKKPVTEEQLFKQLDDIIEDIKSDHIYYSIILSDMVERQINIKDIVYIESSNSKKQILCFHMTDSTLTTKGKIGTWEENLKSHGFIICYKGILVNISHVHYYTKNTISLSNGETIPLSRSYYKKLNTMFFNKIITIKN